MSGNIDAHCHKASAWCPAAPIHTHGGLSGCFDMLERLAFLQSAYENHKHTCRVL